MNALTAKVSRITRFCIPMLLLAIFWVGLLFGAFWQGRVIVGLLVSGLLMGVCSLLLFFVY